MYKVACSKVQYFKLCFESSYLPAADGDKKSSTCILLHVLGHKFLRAFMLKKVRMITVMNAQNRIFWRYVQIKACIFGILCVDVNMITKFKTSIKITTLQLQVLGVSELLYSTGGCSKLLS